MTTVRYEGERLHAGPTVFTVDENGLRLHLEHRVHVHGFGRGTLDWGYAGQRSAELALNLLVDALGDRATCARCHGKGQYRGSRCYECAGWRIDPVVFGARHPLMWVYVVGLPSVRWSIERSEIVAWFERFTAGLREHAS